MTYYCDCNKGKNLNKNAYKYCNAVSAFAPTDTCDEGICLYCGNYGMLSPDRLIVARSNWGESYKPSSDYMFKTEFQFEGEY